VDALERGCVVFVFAIGLKAEMQGMSDETTSTDHGFIRAWAEAREGRPAMLQGRVSAGGQPLLRFDFGTPEPGLTEIAWHEFFDIFERDQLALEYRDTPGHLGRLYKFVSRHIAT
jgi:hypothetical protein